MDFVPAAGLWHPPWFRRHGRPPVYWFDWSSRDWFASHQSVSVHEWKLKLTYGVPVVKPRVSTHRICPATVSTWTIVELCPGSYRRQVSKEEHSWPMQPKPFTDGYCQITSKSGRLLNINYTAFERVTLFQHYCCAVSVWTSLSLLSAYCSDSDLLLFIIPQ